MLTKLKKIYPSLIPYNPKLKHQYEWFITTDDMIFGVPKKELPAKELQLLQTIFQSYEPHLPERSPLEQRWHDRISGTVKQNVPFPFRFIYFSIQKGQMSPEEFQEAFTTLFEKAIPILWQNETEGVIIEEIQMAEEQIQFEQIIHILIADLSVNIRFFVGPVRNDDHSLQNDFANILSTGKRIFNLTNHLVIDYTESIPYLLLEGLTDQEKRSLCVHILKGFYDDDDMLETLDLYFKYNLNLSETAKNMYMHRNSLQYRIDKFSKETGIPIQSFNHAISVKLAILAKKMLER